MTPDERLAELGAILARGVARHRVREKALAGGGDDEALWRRAVDGDGAAAPEEHDA